MFGIGFFHNSCQWRSLQVPFASIAVKVQVHHVVAEKLRSVRGLPLGFSVRRGLLCSNQTLVLCILCILFFTDGNVVLDLRSLVCCESPTGQVSCVVANFLSPRLVSLMLVPSTISDGD